MVIGSTSETRANRRIRRRPVTEHSPDPLSLLFATVDRLRTVRFIEKPEPKSPPNADYSVRVRTRGRITPFRGSIQTNRLIRIPFDVLFFQGGWGCRWWMNKRIFFVIFFELFIREWRGMVIRKSFSMVWNEDLIREIMHSSLKSYSSLRLQFIEIWNSDYSSYGY